MIIGQQHARALHAAGVGDRGSGVHGAIYRCFWKSPILLINRYPARPLPPPLICQILCQQSRNERLDRLLAAWGRFPATAITWVDGTCGENSRKGNLRTPSVNRAREQHMSPMTSCFYVLSLFAFRCPN